MRTKKQCILLCGIIAALILTMAGCKNPSFPDLKEKEKKPGPQPEITFTVTFNSNEGSEVAPITVVSGSTIATLPTPTRDEYNFVGWFTNDGTYQERFTDSTPVTANITVYAQWTQVLYTVTFDSNGGSSVDTLPVASGSTIATLPTPTRDEYNFVGWFTDNDNWEKPFTSSTPVTADITVYAQWTQILYTVTFDSNGGSSVDTLPVASGSTITLPAAPDRSGYAFGGWFIDDETFADEFSSSTVVTADITVYAKWKPLYTVTFNSNSGSPVVPITVVSGSTIPLPKNPTRAGNTFAGWYIDNNTFDNQFTASTPVTANITVYAKWTVTITFNSNGGSSVVAKTGIVSGSTIALPVPPVKGDYFFMGWYTDNNTFANKFTTSTSVTANMTVHARWSLAEMKLIGAGTFTMGSPAGEPNRGINETQHSVTLSAFYMGKYEVTQAQYKAVMGNNPSYFNGENLPVEKVIWYEAIVFCNKLSMMEGLTPAYSIGGKTNPGEWGAVPTVSNTTWDAVVCNWNANGYRLPTDAEWEYACRAGTMTPFSTGNNITTAQANYNGNYPYNGNPKGVYRGRTTAVGTFGANPRGLYDMHGNVYEWCWDWRGNNPTTPQTNPHGASSGIFRVNRGGSWSSEALSLRSALRSGSYPYYRDTVIGFRLVRSQA